MDQDLDKNRIEGIADDVEVEYVDAEDEETLEVDDSGLIKSVADGSIAQQIGLEQGDIIALVNGRKAADIFDYRLACASEKIVLTVLKKDMEVWEVEVEKEEDADLGIEFEYPLLSEEKSCRNKCIFCFIDQLPPNMRETMYFKDDDPRLSFLTGNYVSLTNIDDEELKRIIRFRLSPINVSVHTTDPELRCKMLNNRFAGDILRKIKMITDAGLTVNAQIVLCKGYNDGQNLVKTVEDLAALYPGVQSVSVVPVGITAYRQGLTPLEPFGKVDSGRVIDSITELQEKYHRKMRPATRFVYLADEFYVNAERDIPDIEVYDEFPQIENGVGMVAALREDVRMVCESLLESEDNADALLLEEHRRVTVICGEAMRDNMKVIADIIRDTFQNLDINIIVAKNYFFGGHVTVTGLLTGSDVLKAVEGLSKDELGDAVLLSDAMLRDGEDVFLDDMTLDELRSRIPVEVRIIDHLSGSELVSNAVDIELEISYEEDDDSDVECEYTDFGL